jgi:hypothetical protein
MGCCCLKSSDSKGTELEFTKKDDVSANNDFPEGRQKA